MPELSYRPYREGDEGAIRALFADVYGRELSLDVWRWRFERSPAGRGVIELAWDGDVLAGHYAVTPVWLSRDGERIRTGLSGTTMTHRDYRGLGLFQVLAERTYRRMQEEGFAAVWGFPNSNSHRGFVERLGWRDIERVPFLSLELTGRVPPAPRLEVAPMRADTPGLDALGRAMAGEYGWMVVRDAEYARWRYLEHPERPYTAWVATSAGEPVAYSVTKVYRDRLQVVDLAFRDPGVAVDLVARAVHTAASAGQRHVDLWMPLGCAVHRGLERLGFVPTGPVTYFGVGAFAGCPRDIASPSAWYYAMSDSDVF